MGIFDDILGKMTGGEQKQDGEMKDAIEQPQEDLELAGYVKGKFEEVRAQATRISHEGIWMTNTAYLLGFDSVYYDPALRQFRPISKSPGYLKRNRVHTNILLQACQTRLARMIKTPPKYDVRPNSMSEDDKQAARKGVEQINYVWDKETINKKRIELGMWLQQCGHAYLKVSYDDQKGEPMLDPTTNEIVGYEGDVRIDVVSAFEGYPDPLAKSMEDLTWFGQAKVRKLDYFRTHYERGHLVKDESAWLLSAQYEMRINTLNSVGPSSSSTQEQMKNAAIELNYYEKRSKDYPNGRHIIVANGVILKNGELPCGEIPFVKFDDVVIGGKFYSESLVTHGRPIQDQYNRVLSKRSDWESKLLAGKYIAARGHGLMQEALTNESGEVVEYDPVPNAAEPHAMQIPVMPAYVYQSLDSLKRELFELFGLSDVSRGQMPSASIPAQGMQILLDADETRIGVEIEQHEHAFAKLGQLILKYTAKYYTSERPLKTKGQSLKYNVSKIKGDDLRKNFDCIVIRGSTVPNIKPMKRQEILNLYGQGLLGNPQDPAVVQKVLAELEFGDIASVWEDYHIDMNQIQETIKMIEKEEMPVVDKLDNHILHLMEKNKFRKGDRFKAMSDVSKLLFEHDIQSHISLGAIAANPQLAHPPDNMPHPDQMIAELLQNAPPEVTGNMPIDNSAQPPQNI